MLSDLDSTIQQWCRAPDISARSLVVTIFGDSVIPLTSEMWLSGLFELCAPFGFNERLVRTSLFRLAAEGWVENERVGRRSRYTLTDLALRESASAAKRIYRNPPSDWNNQWTIVLPETSSTSSTERELLAKHLKWQGFVELSRGVLALPGEAAGNVSELARRLGLNEPPMLRAAEFSDLERLVTEGLFSDAFEIDSIEEAYRRFHARYSRLLKTAARVTSPRQAFALATIMIHEFRRIRLRLSGVPDALLPHPWIGDSAYDLAAELYCQIDGLKAEFVAEALEVEANGATPGRFAFSASHN